MSIPLQKSTDCQCQMWDIQWRIYKIEGTLVDQGHYFRYFGPSFLATKIKREQVAFLRKEKRKGGNARIFPLRTRSFIA